MIEKVLAGLEWSGEKEISQGVFAYSATPNSEFWNLWRADKSAVKDAGVSVRPLPNRDWIVEWVRNERLAPSTSDFVPVDFIAAALPANIEFSEEQLGIFSWFRAGPNAGNRVVRARAGTGKTFTIIHGFSQAPEARMLYAVFNKKNQKEAEKKIADKRVSVLTLHALGFRYIRNVWHGVKPEDSVEYDRIEATCGEVPDAVRNALIKLVGFAKNILIVPTVGAIVSIAEDRDIDCEELAEENLGGWTLDKLARSAVKVIEAAKVRDAQSRISFNDMVWLPVAMNWVRAWYDLVVIDEAQDMNAPQLQMARDASKGRVCVVGDDRQAIYGFRGAVQNGLDLMKSELNAEELTLTITRRCPKSVVALAVEYVPDYKSADDAPEGTVSHLAYENIFKSVQPGDAILSRINAPLMPLCLGLLRNNIPARIEGRDIGKMLLGIVEKLKAKSVPDFIKKAIAHGERAKVRASRQKNSEQKIEAIEDQTATLIALAEGAKNVEEIKSRCVSLFQDSENNPRLAVVLSSTHKAKGLEWNKVLVLRDTYLRKGRESREEENLYYVAITRAKSALVFVASKDGDA
jgi:DNA helicase-2/ATP-dependent DNA helicase PcrA